jgi:LAO/AO transport system kinase
MPSSDSARNSFRPKLGATDEGITGGGQSPASLSSTLIPDLLMGLIDRLLAGERRALSRTVSIVEQGGPGAREVLARLFPHTGRAHIVGVTGPPGAGKSTLVNELALEMRRRGRTVAIVAVDPTSPFTGGAILGDRIRMQPLGGDPGVFVRSMASRGQLGGIAHATGAVVKVFDAAGFDLVIVETIGAGQAEVEIAREAQSTVVVEVPGLGDDIQALKAGILEIADIFVVNKADREGADKTRRQLQMMLHMAEQPDSDWSVPVLMTVATKNEGIAAVVDALERHRQQLEAGGRLARREQDRIERELDTILQVMALELVRARVPDAQRAALVERIHDRIVDPYTAAEELLGDALGVVGPI